MINKSLLFAFYFIFTLYYLCVVQLDIRSNFFSDGLVLSDDRNYFISAINNTYNENSKNYIYYVYNNLLQNITGDVFIIVFINSTIFVLSLWFFISSYKLKPNKYFILSSLYFPVYFVCCVNYKDSIYMSLIILFFAVKKNHNLNFY